MNPFRVVIASEPEVRLTMSYIAAVRLYEVEIRVLRAGVADGSATNNTFRYCSASISFC